MIRVYQEWVGGRESNNNRPEQKESLGCLAKMIQYRTAVIKRWVAVLEGYLRPAIVAKTTLVLLLLTKW